LLGALASPQGGCPAASDFAAARTQVLPISFSRRFAVDSVWVRVDTSLRAWWHSDFAPGDPVPGRTLSPGFDLLSVDPAQLPQTKQSGRSAAYAQRTCYFVAPSGYTDRRIAFLLLAWPRSGTNVWMLQLWWLADSKGRSERSWREGSDELDVLAARLIGRLSRIRKPK
jgi:hypothetical protein